MYHICLIPGLGVDERLFQYLKLDTRYGQTILRWLTPAAPAETLTHYAQRLTEQLPASHEKLLFIGVSFGGIMAIEMAKLVKPVSIILISSIKTKYELPWYFRLAGFLNLPALLPLQLGKYFYGLQAYVFGAKTPTEAQLLHQVIKEIEMPYLRWSLTQIATWQNTQLMPNLVHLHGTSDKIFPVKYLRHYTPVSGGEHLMVISRAAEVQKLIEAELEKLPGMPPAL